MLRYSRQGNSGKVFTCIRMVGNVTWNIHGQLIALPSWLTDIDFNGDYLSEQRRMVPDDQCRPLRSRGDDVDEMVIRVGLPNIHNTEV